eukprot:2720749-Pyramimonas_sp.AAC.1
MEAGEGEGEEGEGEGVLGKQEPHSGCGESNQHEDNDGIRGPNRWPRAIMHPTLDFHRLR